MANEDAGNERMTKASRATATRDLQELLQIGVLIKEGQGRSVRYRIRLV